MTGEETAPGHGRATTGLHARYRRAWASWDVRRLAAALGATLETARHREVGRCVVGGFVLMVMSHAAAAAAGSGRSMVFAARMLEMLHEVKNRAARSLEPHAASRAPSLETLLRENHNNLIPGDRAPRSAPGSWRSTTTRRPSTRRSSFFTQQEEEALAPGSRKG